MFLHNIEVCCDDVTTPRVQLDIQHRTGAVYYRVAGDGCSRGIHGKEEVTLVDLSLL